MYNPLDFKLLAAQGLARKLGLAVYVVRIGKNFICSPAGGFTLTCATPVSAYRALVHPNGEIEHFNKKEV